MNIIKSLPKALGILRKPLKVKYRPENLQIDINTTCNLNCKMCPRDALEGASRNAVMPFDKFAAAFDKILPNSVNLAATGEPFIHPEFFRIAAYAKKHGAATFTSSNFTQIKENTLNEILSSGLGILKISLDAADCGTYVKIRGKDYFNNICENIKKLISLKEKSGSKTPSIRIDCVILKDNYAQIEALVRLADELKVDAVFFRLLDATRLSDKKKTDNIEGIDIDSLFSMIKKAAKTAKELGVNTNLNDIIAENVFLFENYNSGPAGKAKMPSRGICLLPWTQLFVDVTGEASPCCSLYPSGQTAEGGLGNIFSGSLDAVWNGGKMEELRRIFKEKRNYSLFKACARCNSMDFSKLLTALKYFPGLLKAK